MLNIDVNLTLKSSLHIGAIGPAGTSAVRGMVKDLNGWPYIPASSLKGRLRHTLERLSPLLGLEACDTHRSMCREMGKACPACRIFGSPWIPGRLRFVDLRLREPAELSKMQQTGQICDPSLFSQRFGVALSRRQRTSAEHLLYTTELFQPGVELVFGGVLSGPLTLKEAAWVVAGLRALDSLGGGRTRGLGWLEAQVKVTEKDRPEPYTLDELRQALEDGE